MTTIATGWKITRRDAVVLAFTSHDVDKTISGVTYKSSAGFSPSSIERTTALESDNQSLIGIIDSDEITAADLRSGKYDGARVEIIEFDWSTDTKLRTLLIGFLGGISLEGNRYTADLRSIESELQKPIGRTVKLRCDADLGDARCGFSLTADSLTVTAVTSDLEFADSSLAVADGYYNGGKITWLSGANAGLTFDVKRYIAATKTVELWEPVIYSITVGDTANIYRGCDKTFPTCRDTFNNAARFRGFPYVPGVKDLVGGGLA